MPYMKNENGMTQRNRAYTLLREALVAGKIPGGSRLREAEWAGRLRVNRSALREAFGRLCGEGLLVEGPKRGYFVAHFEPDEVKDVLEVSRRWKWPQLTESAASA